jgi:hypothetical protein
MIVHVSQSELRLWAYKWPGHNIPVEQLEDGITFEFSGGDLVGIESKPDSSEFDGAELSALADDAEQGKIGTVTHRGKAQTFAHGEFARPLGTYLDAEEKAYPAGSLRQSRRHGRAVCSDGIVRRVKLGIADTYSTIPAICYIRGHRVHGYVSSLPTDLRLDKLAPTNSGEVIAFYPLGKHRDILPDWAFVTAEQLFTGPRANVTDSQGRD